MLQALIDAWLAANAYDSVGVKRHCAKLGIHTYLGYFNKPELTLLDPKLAKQLDNGTWVNHPTGTPLTEDEKLEELALCRKPSR